MSKRGFTLIELLAVIVIIAVVTLISVPVIINIINDSRKGVFKVSVQSLFKAYETYKLKNPTIEEKVSILDLPITRKENFTSGKVYKEGNNIKVENVGNGTYCASGTIENLQVIEGSCDVLDTTAPIIETVTTDSTTSSIKVYTTYFEEESFLSKHEYRIALISENIEEKEWINGDTLTGNLSTKTFSGLTLGTIYKIQIRLTNTSLENNVSEIKEMEATTLTIEKPVITLLTDKEYATKKEVKITYPTGTNLLYEYNIDGTWEKAEEMEITITIEENKTVRARASDGTNIVEAETLTISGIDKTEPTITLTKEELENKTVLIAQVEPESTLSGYHYIWYKDEQELILETTNRFVMTDLGIYKVKVVTGAGIEVESNKIEKVYTALELLQNSENVLGIDRDKNLRYVGADPNNYVRFNNELWRIVGVFDGQAKLIRNDSYFTGNWDETNCNDWSVATLQKKLNEDFLLSINEKERSYIDTTHIWHLGGVETDHTIWTRENLYQWERGLNTYEGRPVTWTGSIGLLYPSDFGYSTSSTMECTTENFNVAWIHSDCQKNSWLTRDIPYWTITPMKEDSGLVIYVNPSGYIEHHYAFYGDFTLPTLYLKATVKIKSGSGTNKDPYLLGI